MAAEFSFYEDNNTAAGTPATGTVRTSGVTQCNWKNLDDVTTSYALYPIRAGGNSFTKYQFCRFFGTFNQISNGLWNHTTGNFDAGLAVKFATSSGYATPATGVNASLTGDITLTGLITTGLPLFFSTIGPERAQSGTLTQAGYSNYIATQLQTTAAAPPGDLSSVITFTVRYDES